MSENRNLHDRQRQLIILTLDGFGNNNYNWL